MGLLDDIVPPEPKKHISRITRLLEEELSSDERVAVLDALEKIRENQVRPNTYPGYTMQWLYEVLRNNGHRVDVKSIRKWLRETS